MKTQLPRVFTLTTLLLAGADAFAQQDTPDSQSGFVAAVTDENVNVRSGPSIESEYPFGKVNAGDLVWVLEQDHGWGRVATHGPAFDEMYAYITVGPRVEPSVDGKTGVITAQTDVMAANISASNRPESSWRRIATLASGETVRILGTVEGRSGEVYKIVLPEKAEGWINFRFLRPATDQENQQFKQSLNRNKADQSKPPNEQSRGIPTRPSPGESPQSQAPPNSQSRPPQRSAQERMGPMLQTKQQIQRNQQPETDGRNPQTNQSLAREEDKQWADPTSDFQNTRPSETPAKEQAARDKSTSTDPRSSQQPTSNGASKPADDEVTLDELDEIYQQMREPNPRTAEFEPLYRQYRALAQRESSDASTKRYANARARQLQIRARIQNRLRDIRALKERAEMAGQTITDTRIALENTAEYVAMGRLNASTVYDGERLPRLYRIVDQGAGNTVAYVEPDESFDLTGMIGQLVGIVGMKEYDPGLQLNLVTPQRIDILTANQMQQ